MPVIVEPAAATDWLLGNNPQQYLRALPHLSQNHAMIAIEDLQVRNMSASAAGTLDDPSHNVKAKSGLNRAILDQG